MSNYNYGRAYRSNKTTEILMEYRKKYPFRLVKSHSSEPDPQSLEGKYGKFFRWPDKRGDEWGFTTKLDRDLFCREHGGTVIGE